MTARRQASTTSLSKYLRESSPGPADRSLDFCNAFWGLGDGGVDVLFARMRGASRTMTELRAYWKERSSIEEDYAKRMSKLAKVPLGKDEIGELRNSLDTLRLETDKQGEYHLKLSKQIRDDLEGPTATFIARQAHHKKTFQAGIEKKFKTKQQQESHVKTAGEKYKQDCVRINSYTAQSTLMQGRELDKIQTKLERAQQTVQANERDFASFTKALQATAVEWEQDWKVFCDSCQDQEEERMEFMKDTMWAYANAVSTVCVSDDESCEHMRVALEQMEPEKDMDNFVRDYGTGNAIPDPPPFVNYNSAEAVPAGSSRLTSRPAQFARTTQRHLPFKAPPPPQDDEPFVNTAGVGALGKTGTSDSTGDVALPTRSQSQSRASNRGQSQTNGAGQGAQVSRHATTVSRQPTNYQSPPQNDPNSESASSAPNEQYMLKVGNGAYRVDPSNDPQQAQAGSRGLSQADSFMEGEDPLAAKMNELRSAATGQTGQRRNSTYRASPAESQPSSDLSRRPTRGGPSLSPPSSSNNAGNSQHVSRSSNDYRKSAEIVVGSYPGAAVSRPVSPNPPTAPFTRPPEQNAPTSSLGDVESVLQNYGQTLPGERKSSSRRNSFINTPNNVQGQSIERAPSREGHAGIGAHGLSRSPSPAPQPAPGPARRNSRVSPTPAGSVGRATSVRAPAPTNSVGIALDPSGKVAVDAMADRYRQPQQQPAQQPPPPQQPPQPSPSYNVAPVPSRNGNHVGYGAPNPNMAPPVQQPAYPPPPQPTYSQPAYNTQPQRPAYTQPAYTQPPPAHYPPPAPSAQPVYHGGSYSNNSLSRAPSNAGYNNSHLVSPQHPYGTGGRTPSPQPPPQPLQPSPTGAYTDDGRPILFYVKALYDYGATIEEEFDFQSGDIIAVTATPEDGWWSGELLDEARRQPGRHVFPSNFVCLF